MRRFGFVLTWLLTDIAVFLGSFALAYFLRVGFIFSSDFPFGPNMAVAALVSPFWLAALISTRTFALLRKQMSLKTLLYIVYASTMAVALFVLVYYFTFDVFFSRMLLVQALVLTVAFTWIWHLAFGFITRQMMRRNPAAYPTLIIGATREAGRLIEGLQKSSPLRPVAVLDSHAGKDQALHGVPVVGRLNKLEDVLKKERITHIIQCSDLEHAMNFVALCKQRGMTYMLLPSVLGVIGEQGRERVDMLEGHPMTIVDPSASAVGSFFR